MARAAARGAVDFARARPSQPSWWRALGLSLGEVEDADVAFLLAERNRVDLAAVASGILTPESFDSVLKSSTRRLDLLQKLLRPWEDGEPADDKDDAAARMKAAWVATWGDPEAPETAANIAATVASLKAMNKAR